MSSQQNQWHKPSIFFALLSQISSISLGISLLLKPIVSNGTPLATIIGLAFFIGIFLDMITVPLAALLFVFSIHSTFSEGKKNLRLLLTNLAFIILLVIPIWIFFSLD